MFHDKIFQAALHLETKRQEESAVYCKNPNELAVAATAVAQEFEILMRAYPPGSAAENINEAGHLLEKLNSLRAAVCFRITG